MEKGKNVGDSEGLLWTHLKKFVNLIDELRDFGLQEHINLPRIAVLGTQSSGKSSVLESIVGLDFLPRGDGLVTRRPLELRLHHLQEDSEPWATFEEIKGKQFRDFKEVRTTIEQLTDKVAGTRRNIVDKPIKLNVYSNTCPDLTLIDLPGITRIPLKDSDEPINIEEITTKMAKRYCVDERTIILCVIPAVIDITTSEALQYALKWDKHQVRTLGVITKLDIMNQGSDAKQTLLNEQVFLKLGYVGVKNRSQQDILDKVGVQRGLEAERKWFMEHPVYRVLPKDCYGTDTLIGKLSKIMYAHIRSSLPDILKEVQEKLKMIEERLKDLGPSLPVTEREKTQALWAMVSNFTSLFKRKIKGKLALDNMRRAEKKKLELCGGAKIRVSFIELFSEYASPEYRVSSTLKDKEIESAIILNEGDGLPGFPSQDVFYYLVQPEIEKLKEPAKSCLLDTYYYLEELAYQTLEKAFVRFPAIIPEIMVVTRAILTEAKDRAMYIVESLIECETNYMFTNDTEYIGKRSDVIPRFVEADKGVEPLKVYIKELRTRIDSYYHLVVRNVRDSVPKIIGSFLVRAVQDKMHMELTTRLMENPQINELLNEPASVTEERKRLTETKNILNRSLKAIQRDPKYIPL